MWYNARSMSAENGRSSHSYDLTPSVRAKVKFREHVRSAVDSPTRLRALNDCIKSRKLTDLTINSGYRIVRAGAYWLHERNERRIARRQERDPEYRAEYAQAKGLVADVRIAWYNYFRHFGVRESLAETRAIRESTIDVVREKAEVMKEKRQKPLTPSTA